MKKVVYKISGMHCKSCEILIEDKIKELGYKDKINVDNQKGIAEISYKDEKPDEKEIRRALKDMGYELIGVVDDVESNSQDVEIVTKDKNTYYELIVAIIISISLYMLFSVLKLDKFFNIDMSSDSISWGAAILMGITAGVSTCMALVGGLIMGVSTKFNKSNPDLSASKKFIPHIFFNIGRIAGFFVLGGLLGLFGSIFQLSLSTTGILTIAVAIFMLIIGLQLTNVFPILSKINITLPKSVSRFFGVTDDKKYSHKGTLLLGALTFFLPCGFTQAMQLYAISSGDFITGGMIMALFAIGTAPGLLGIGGLTSFIKGDNSGLFFKVAGIIVIIFAAVNFVNGYNLSLVKDVKSSSSNNSSVADSSSCSILKDGEEACSLDNVDSKTQILKTTFNVIDDIQPTNFRVNVGVPVRFEINASENGSGCMSTIMIPGLFNKPKFIEKGLNVLNFTPTKPGTYPITCAMGVNRGTLIVQ